MATSSQAVSLLAVLVLAVNSVHSGFLGSPTAYSAGFSAPPYLPYAAPPPAHFAPTTYSSPLPVAPISVNTYSASAHHSYVAPPPAIVKLNSGFNPFTSYSAPPPVTKFATSSHLPTVYSGPLPFAVASPTVAYNGFGGPNTVVKYGPPTTTTTTTYSTATAGAVAPVATAYAAPYAGPIGW